MDILAILNRIEVLLKDSGRSKSDLYAACSVSSSAVSQWKSGRTRPSVRSLQNIADYLNVSYEYLISGVGQKQKAPIQDEVRPRRPIKLKIKEWKSNKSAHLDMHIDSELLNLITIFAGEDGISLEDEVEKILHEDVEHRIEEWASEVAAREYAQLPIEDLYPPRLTDDSAPADPVAPIQEAEQEQPQPEQQKMPTPVSEDGQDDLEQFIRAHKKNLTAGQEQKILEMMQSMIASQKQQLSISAQSTVDDKSPKKGRLGYP